MNGLLAFFVVMMQQASTPEAGAPPPEKVFERVQHALFARSTSDGGEAGVGELDPLLWHDSTWPADVARRDAVLAALDEFLAMGDEVRSVDVARRVVLQRDAWSIFDWLLEHGADEALLARLATLMYRVALTPEECAALPDIFAFSVPPGAPVPDEAAAPEDPEHPGIAASPGVPPDLLAPDGDWVCVGAADGEPLAPRHVQHFAGRSVFTVHLRLPGGRSRTLEYLSSLTGVPDPTAMGADGWRHLKFTLPQFPEGTTLALLRRALHVDRDGGLHPTPLVESLQLREHARIPALVFVDDTAPLLRNDPESLLQEQHFSELLLDRAALAGTQPVRTAKAGVPSGLPVTLRALRSDPPFTTFITHGDPAPGGGPLPQPRRPEHGQPERGKGAEALPSAAADLESSTIPLQRCVSCHGHPGVYAWNSFTTIMTGAGTIFTAGSHGGPRALLAQPPEREALLALEWKRKQPSWEALAARWPRPAASPGR